jgi:hypothetical protein
MNAGLVSRPVRLGVRIDPDTMSDICRIGQIILLRAGYGQSRSLAISRLSVRSARTLERAAGGEREALREPLGVPVSPAEVSAEDRRQPAAVECERGGLAVIDGENRAMCPLGGASLARACSTWTVISGQPISSWNELIFQRRRDCQS